MDPEVISDFWGAARSGEALVFGFGEDFCWLGSGERIVSDLVVGKSGISLASSSGKYMDI